MLARLIFPPFFFCFLLVFFTLPATAQLLRKENTLTHRVIDATYGEVLFEYYQGEDFLALTRLLVALERKEFLSQSDKGQIMLGNLYLRYGILPEAEAIFSKVLEQTKNKEVALRAWFYLSRLYYQQSDYVRAIDVLDNRLQEVPHGLQQKYDLLYAKTLMKLGRYSEAVARLSTLNSTNLAGSYLKYNLAIIRLNAGITEDSDSLLWQLRNQKRAGAEKNALIELCFL